MSFNEKSFIVKGYKVGRNRYKIESEEFGISSVYKGKLHNIYHRIKQECKRLLVFNAQATYLCSAPNPISDEENYPDLSSIGKRDMLFFIRIPMDEVDVDKVWENRYKLKTSNNI